VVADKSAALENCVEAEERLTWVQMANELASDNAGLDKRYVLAVLTAAPNYSHWDLAGEHCVRRPCDQFAQQTAAQGGDASKSVSSGCSDG